MNRLRWAYGVTTVPERRSSLLPQTLNSLQLSGFTNPFLFVDGDKDSISWEKEFNLNVSCRYPRLRTAGNWVLSIYELYIRDPSAERYAIFQDDLVAIKNLRGYLDKCGYPENGYLNLYTFADNEPIIRGKKPGWYEGCFVRSGPPWQAGRGAVGLVFDRKALVTLLSSLHIVDRFQDIQQGWRKIDGGIVTAMNKAGYKEFIHNPSLLQHTGKQSSMKNMRHPSAHSFPGEDKSALIYLS